MQEQESDLQRAGVLHLARTHLLACVAALTGLGLVMVYSASSVRAARYGWDVAFLHKQLLWLVVGLVGASVTYWLPTWLMRRFAWAIGGVTLLLLMLVRVPGIGHEVNGAYRWLRVGGYNMQPSELAKLGMVIAVAAFLSRFPTGKGLPFFRGFLPAAVLIGLTSGLVMIEPDFGTAALIGVVLTSVLIVGGAKIWQVCLLGAAAVPPGVYIGLTRFDHILARLDAWRNGTGDAAYQINMSKIALGSGGIAGMGLGNGTSKLFYLPEAHTDFIFAILGQELGLIGTLAVVAVFLYMLVLGMLLVSSCAHRFHALFVFGVTGMIGLQAAFNIAVVTASIPPKGISLPFISFGGSGLSIALTAMGLVAGIARREEREALAGPLPQQDGNEDEQEGELDAPGFLMKDAA